jgi:hypothetical protein
MVCVSFSLEDLFVVGIGFDIAGALLVGRGLLTSPIGIARRATSYLGYSGPLATSQIEDKVDGMAGLAALVLGFILQATGYAFVLSRHAGGAGHLATAITALALAALAIAFVFGVWWRLRLPLIKRQAVEVARFNVFTLPVEVMERPYSRLLIAYGEELGFELRTGETDDAYAHRVFGVTEIEPGRPQQPLILEG